MTTVLTRMIHLKNDHKDPNESGCNDTMQCSGCGGSMGRELILELFENDAQVYPGWWSGYRCCACGKLPQTGQDLGLFR